MEIPRKKKSPDEDVKAATKPDFIVDDVNGEAQDADVIRPEDSESDREDDHLDAVRATCDNGLKRRKVAVESPLEQVLPGLQQSVNGLDYRIKALQKLQLEVREAAATEAKKKAAFDKRLTKAEHEIAVNEERLNMVELKIAANEQKITDLTNILIRFYAGFGGFGGSGGS